MTVVVMCDGAPASLKAAGWAAVPGNLMRQHDGEQLILVHAWSRDAALRPTQSRESPDKPLPLDDAHSLNRLPLSQVVKGTLETITESKVTRDTLNYKLETMILADPVPHLTFLSAAPMSQVSAKAPLTKKELAVQQKQQQQQQTSMPTDSEVEAVARDAEKEEAQSRATAIALYAKERALHHHAKTILLGAGNSMDGKSILLGLVAKTVLRDLRQTNILWFIKNNGRAMRPTTAMVRYVVVLVPASNDAQALERDCSVVQYALGCRRERSMDTVSAVLVVESATSPEEVERYSQTLRAMLQRSTTAMNLQEADDVDAEDPPPPLASPVTHAPPSLEKNGVTPGEGTPQEAVVDAGEPLPAAEEVDSAAEQQQWPEVSLCALRTTKQVAVVTAGNAAGQVVKFLQRHKTDIVVSPSTLPEELHMALLAMSKPHVLIVPLAEPAAAGGDVVMAPPEEKKKCTE
ncbi:hypothetical protein TraAM80_01434 [Trypanosoma rangeli]|uniref:Uncharacterized protein n=1 Tax=Trypanosoma rangeli TaxID=5698 RepID=A0A3R7P0A0_TRYRA|nr:uncharacterized protein TraAM80_01434 [Trypanosoma rangeli]RNF10618.1 hypothetical protein TraAM80_01434 [Trypanosoma rangeli]|eukprot:RNF10618.1 hypothetical protein TraAM80_01434 [Trypanosoma rangeli]